MTPCYPAVEMFQDPTHVSVWTDATMGYFSNDPRYEHLQESYGIKCRFRQMSYSKVKDGGSHMRWMGTKE